MKWANPRWGSCLPTDMFRSRAVEQLQMVFAYRNAYLFNRRVFIPGSYTILDEQGDYKDSDLRERLELQAEKFQAFTKAIKALP